MAAMPSLAADGAEPLVGGGLDADPAHVEVEGLGDVDLHVLQVGGDLRFLGEDRGVDVDQSALVEGDLAGGFLEEHPAGTFCQRGSVFLKKWPMSGSPSAPRTASQMACIRASASE
jgi:hypothetical protein